jgi:hypothetical protein
MTASISSSVGTAPLNVAPQPASTPSIYEALGGGTNLGGASPDRDDFSMELPGGALGGTGITGTSGAGPVTGGGGAQAATGAANVTPEQLAAAIKDVVTATNALAAAIQAQGGIVGGGGSGVGACGMAGCDMDHSAGTAGAAGAPKQVTQHTGHAGADATSAAATATTKQQSKVKQPGSSASTSAAAAAPVDPSNIKDKTGQAGLTSASKRGLVEAHKFGLPLVSGKRAGSTAKSDHASGNAIDVSTLPIGVASSHGATPKMQAFRERMRAAGKAGELGVKYIISDGRIASATSDWNWRPYTYPGKSASQLAALKSSNLGEYNRIQHFDHVHVSFN